MAGQVWATAAEGGYMYSDNLSRVLRFSLQPGVKFRQFADVKDAALQAKKKGDKFHWNVYSDVLTEGAALTENVAMPETNFTITQGEMTVTEYGNSVPFSEKLDELSEHSVTEVIQKVIKNDAKKVFDKAAYAQFNLCPLRVAPTGGTSTSAVTLTDTGTTAITNNIALGTDHVKAIVDIMKERNIPPYMADDYFAIAWPSTFRPMKNQLEQLFKYVESGITLIMNGEIGRYENTRFVEQTNVPKSTWTNAQSGWAFFFGLDTVAEGVVVPEEMRGKIPSDYGRSRGIAWYYLGGFGLVHTTATALSKKNARIVKWDSAA